MSKIFLIDYFFRMLTFLYLPVYNFWLLLCPVKLSYDWQMGSLPLVHFSNITNDLTFITVPLFYGAILWFIFVLLKRLRFHESQITCEKEDNQMMIGVRNVFFKFINGYDFFTSYVSKWDRKNVSIHGSFVMFDRLCLPNFSILIYNPHLLGSYARYFIIKDHLTCCKILNSAGYPVLKD